MNRRQLPLLVLLLLALGGGSCLDGSAGDSTEPEPTIAIETPVGLSDFDPDSPQNTEGLITNNRSTLDVCIQRTDGSLSVAADANVLSSVLSDISASEYYADFYPAHPAVTIGCPPPTLIVGTPVSEYQPELNALRLEEGSASPSMHRVHLYVVPTDEYFLTFGDAPFFSVPAEMLCHGHVCANVTPGVYIPSDGGEPVMAAALLRALGLQEPPADPEWDPAEVEQRRLEELGGGGSE